MKLRDHHFRDYEKKFVEVSNSGNVLSKMGEEDVKEPFIGYMYVDNNRGVTLRLLGNTENEVHEKYLKEKISVAGYDLIEDFDIEIIQEEIPSLEIIRKHTDKHYGEAHIEKVRDRIEIDNLRSRAYPDDVEIVIPYKEGYVEKMWVRSYDYILKENIYIFSLLKDSCYDESLKKGELIACKYFKKNNAEALIFFGKVEAL
ncbi:hypothetical protein NE604_06835 [Anaerofustis stercorihominis]|nr:hypothetical protein [Anaerofustis stercorihominis]MCQ4795351.1 hypothetical protein [Anaerofustis stercorihominis]